MTKVIKYVKVSFLKRKGGKMNNFEITLRKDSVLADLASNIVVKIAKNSIGTLKKKET